MSGHAKHREERSQAYGMTAAAVLLMLGIALFPLLATGWISLHRKIVIFGEDRFVGLANFRYLLHDARFFGALANTVYFVGVAVVGELLLALPLALLLHAPSPARALLRAGVLIPWAIPTVVSARLWGWLFDVEHGLFNRVLKQAFELEVNWLGTPALALHAAIVVDIWKTTPFVALLLLAGLQTIPEDVYRAARVDGAGEGRIFFRITLPLLRPALLLAILFRSLDAFRVFDAIFVLTEGGPANTTETLSIYAYKTLMRAGNFGYGSTLSVATFLCVALLSVLFLRLAGKRGLR